MNSNFTFLKEEYPTWSKDMQEAEKFAFIAPRHAAVLCRITLENAITWLFDNDEELDRPYETHLAALLFSDSFKTIVKPSMFQEIDVVRKIGNNGAHGKKVTGYEALQALKNMFRFLSWISKYYSETDPIIPPFDDKIIPYGNEQDKSQKEIEKLLQENEEKRLAHERAIKREQLLAEENEKLRAEIEAKNQLIAARKEERIEQYQQTVDVPELTSEKETRKQLIDLALREAGWDNFVNGHDVEYPIHNMPVSANPSGHGFIDYVLWDDNGKPLAVVEAKSTINDADKGKYQAFLYANALEEKFGQRPIIFYSNGFKTYLWDDTFYIPRKVSGFYTKEELQTLIRRRTERKDIRSFQVNKNIVERPYQMQAIQRVAEAFVTSNETSLIGRNRKALLVMATGSGKTRTAAAIVEMLTKYNWAKRILFLADRTALVKQAKNAFNEHLPNLSTANLTEENEVKDTRVVFSTYPTMLNRIDEVKNEGDKLFGIGHFDVIIIDEAHRSVYQKYQAIFEYFDALLIGLTATPKKDIDRNTYDLFDIEDDNPTFAYELDAAVEAGYLVPAKAYKVPVKFQREGLKYRELSEKDKKHFEEVFGINTDEDLLEDVEIPSNKINSFLFNAKTVDLVLEHLMNNGFKVESGDKLGKTIIFAKNHKHAMFIEERFNKMYPEYGNKFLQVIDNQTKYAQTLLEDFCYDKGPDKMPQIAVSVDMMDTGVDAPRVLNLVFFKEVKSYTKFWQMVGRGTRKCANVFGPGKDKEFFLIFDICGNFEFFEEFPDGHQSTTVKPLQQRLFEAQTEVVFTIQSNTKATEEEKSFADDYIKQLHQKVVALDDKRFEVRKHLEAVLKYRDIKSWYSLNNSSILEIQNHISHLISYNEDKDEMAKKFDLLIYQLELAILNGEKRQQKLISNIAEIGKALEGKLNIPSVKPSEATIKAVSTDQFWGAISLARIEALRAELRDLIQFLKNTNQEKPVYTYLEDSLDNNKVEEYNLMATYTSLQSYKDRVENFIRKNKNHIVIDKLYKNIPITQQELELLENFFQHEQFKVEEIEKEYQTDSLTLFVRKILGLERTAVEQHFTDFIQAENLNSNQIIFVEKIIDYLNVNGVLDKKMLTQPPFTDYSDSGIFGVFEDTAKIGKIIRLIDEVNENAQRVS